MGSSKVSGHVVLEGAWRVEMRVEIVVRTAIAAHDRRTTCAVHRLFRCEKMGEERAGGELKYDMGGVKC